MQVYQSIRKKYRQKSPEYDNFWNQYFYCDDLYVIQTKTHTIFETICELGAYFDFIEWLQSIKLVVFELGHAN